jgi:PKD repeat protein/uncharacterized membrane protein YgcG
MKQLYFRLLRICLVITLMLVGYSVCAGTNTGLSGDDRSAGPFPIGFSFSYFGNSYTQFFVSTNGLIGFSSGSTAYANSCTPGLSNTLYVFWDDLRTDVSGQPEGKIEYETIGEAPNRKLIVQWTNQYFFGDNLPMGTFQAILFEGTDEIKYQYRNLIQERSKGSSATTAIRGGNSSQLTQISCDLASSIREEQAILFTPDTTRSSYTVNTDAPYEFLDISGLTPLPPMTTRSTWKESITWKWSKIPSLNTYEIHIQTLEGAFVHAEVVGNVDSFTLSSNIEHGKNYIAKVRGSINSGSTWELWSGFSATVLSDQVAPTANLSSFSQNDTHKFTAVFSANDDLSGVSNRALQLSLASDFSSLIFNESMTSGINRYEYVGGEAGQQIYARLVVDDRAGNQTVSNVRDLLVLPPPVADFDSSIESGEATLDVVFNNKSEGAITSYNWDFGNAKFSSQKNPTTQYLLPGAYIVKLRVSGIAGSAESTKTITVTPDLSGPTVTSADFVSGANTQALEGSPVLTQAGKFVVKATDKSKISRVIFTLNGDVLGNVLITNAQGAYEQALDLTTLADGAYTLNVDVYDLLENLTQKTYSVTVDLAAPAVPTIVAPAQGTTINQTTITLSGKSVAGTQVAIANNGTDVIANVPVDSSGNYSATIDVQEGDNLLTVQAQYVGRTKWSSYSAERKVIVNTQIPDAPTGVSATAAKQGQIHVTWNAVTSSNANNQVKGYNIYRATSAFTGKGDAGVGKVNSQPVTTNTFSNLVVSDGTYFYAIAAVNQANNEGALSSVVSAVADSIGPKITQLTYTSDGPVDTASGRMGKGRVSVVATFSEPLRNSPYFAIVPEQGLPISIDLAKSYSDEKVYTGQFTIDQSTGSGTAYVSMSAHDNFGNRGTDVLQGSSLLIDAQGPDLSQLTIAPVEPLKVDATNGLVVNTAIRLSEALKPATQTKLVPLLNGVVVAGYEQGILLNAANDPLAFTGEFSLPHTAAQSAMATLSFAHQAEDDLGNISQKIIGQNQFQVYQGDLPPLDIPADLTATALPGGKVKLRWRAVEKAAAYVLYRQGPSDSTLSALEPITAFEFEDQTTVDGTYLYAVASVRRDNGQESQSAKTQTVSVKADRIAPAKPTNLVLELNGAGIVSRWAAPAVDAEGAPQSQQGLTYNLYRTASPQGQNVGDYSVYTPIQTRIPALIALDTTPSTDEHSYFVTAVDAAGNQSVASDTVYLNFGLLPVSQLHITLDKNSYPVLSWQHKGNGIESYRVFRRLGENAPQLLTPEAIAHTSTTTTYTDTSYNGNQASNGAHQEVVYSVVAVDEFNVESLGHELLLPALSVSLEKTKPVLLERGVMNQLLFHVDNKGAATANGLRLFVTLTENGQQRVHQSELFTVAAGANIAVPVVVGGYDKLDAITDLSLRLEQKPQTNQSITIKQAESVEVGSSSLTVDLLTQDFTRGGVGKVTFTITNNSDVETEVVMATNNSKADSTEVRLILEDLQGNLLTQKAIRQTAGGVINVPSGHTVARIPSKDTFTSGELTINVPAAAPDQVRLRLVIDKYHYQLGKENHVAISGVGTSKEVQLSDTPYYAQVTSVEPLTVNAKNGSVTITGKAIDRATNQPLANVPVSIVTVVRGFERTSTVYSDASGNFILGYKLDGTAGKYRVSAIHPEMTDRPNHGEFTAEGGSVSPADINMKVPRNYVQKIYLRVRADQETNLTNVRLVQLPNGMQQVAELPAGVTVNYQPITTIAANTYKDLTLNFSGDNTAADSGVITYRIEADGHTGSTALGTTTLVYALSPAAPAITTKPTFIDTGVALDQAVYEDVVVTNSGLDLLRNAQVELEMKNASPLPAWISLSTAASLGDIPVGEARAVQIVVAPGVGISDGIYELNLKVKGDNLSAYTVPVFIKVTQSGIGKAFFKVSDIYTSTLDTNKQIIEGVNNARVQLQHENVLTINHTLNTNAKGEVIFEGIPTGRYTYRVTANDHNSVSGRVWIKPDVTSSEKVFLMNNLVNVEWSVREITVEDRYEIKLEATFKTNVPAPVVILKPMAVNLPVMKKGEVFQGEFTLTNHGLIRAYDLIQSLPATNDMVRFELLKEIPSALEPGQVFTLPYRLQALRDFNPASEAAATGGGCGSYSAAYAVSYKGKCVNDAVVTSQTQANFNSNWGCGGSSGGSSGGGGGLGGGYGGGGSGVSYSYGGSPISAEPLWCIADTECDDCNKGNGSAK